MQNEKQKNRWILFIIFGVIIIFMQGCTVLSVVPVTLKEIKDYLITQEKCFAKPVDRVVVASVCSLKKLNFNLKRVEINGEHALIVGGWRDNSVQIRIDEITPGLSKVSSRVVTKDFDRQFASEDALFEVIEATFVQDNLVISDFVSHLAPVYLGPDEKSKVVAYVGDRIDVKSIDGNEAWKQISLEIAENGYIQKKWLRDS